MYEIYDNHIHMMFNSLCVRIEIWMISTSVTILVGVKGIKMVDSLDSNIGLCERY